MVVTAQGSGMTPTLKAVLENVEGLNEEELEMVQKLEEGIDDKILWVANAASFYNIIEVTYNLPEGMDIPDGVVNEIIRRYEAAGWYIERKFGELEYSDGPRLKDHILLKPRKPPL